MRRLERWINVVHKKNTEEDWDTIWIIAGEEGVGKSGLGKHIAEIWYNLLDGQCTADKVKFIALDKQDFVTGLKDISRYQMQIYDEAGELSNMRQMDKFNHMITQAYRVIRGENLFTILILPSVFDLNPFFTTRRARALIQVYKRGQFAFYNRKRLRKIVEINRYYKVKNVQRVPPLFRDKFSIYKGILEEGYEQKKRAKMALTRKKLYQELSESNQDRELSLLKKAKELYGAEGAAELFGVTSRTVYNRLEK